MEAARDTVKPKSGGKNPGGAVDCAGRTPGFVDPRSIYKKGTSLVSRLLRTLIPAFVLVLISGCGGSSTGSSGSGSTGSSNPTTVTFTFNGATPTVVATKIGSGGFTVQTPSSGQLSLSIPSGTTNFLVAYICPVFNGAGWITDQIVVEASTADGTAFTAPCYTTATTGQTGSLTGSVDASAISGASMLNIDAQSGINLSSAYVGSATGNFSLTAAAGNDRVAVLAYGLTSGSNGQVLNLVGMKNFSSQAVPGALNGGSAVVLGATDQTSMEPITYNSVPSGYSAPSAVVSYEMGGTSGFLVTNLASTQYPAVPAGAVQSGDYYVFNATAHNSSNPSETVAVNLNSTGGPVSFTFPTPWTYAGPTPAALPTFDFVNTGFTGKTGVSQNATLTWVPGTFQQSVVQVMATANYQNGSTSLTFPDLSSVPGFLAAPASGVNVNWGAGILQSDSGFLQPTSSSTMQNEVLNTGAYTEP